MAKNRVRHRDNIMEPRKNPLHRITTCDIFITVRPWGRHGVNAEQIFAFTKLSIRYPDTRTVLFKKKFDAGHEGYRSTWVYTLMNNRRRFKK